MKAYNPGDHYQQKVKSPLSDQKLLSKSTSICKCCEARFTSWDTVFENVMKRGPKGGILDSC